jgi:hypothetical protein
VGYINFHIKNRTDDIIVQSSLGCTIKGFTLPYPHPQDSMNWHYALTNRMLLDMPEVDLLEYRKFIRFTHKFLTSLFGQYFGIRDEDILTLEQWLEESTYNEDQKFVIRQDTIKEEGIRLDKIRGIRSHKIFIKGESYMTWKPPRLIFPPKTAMKGIMGPLIATVEKIVYNCKYCIKCMTPQHKAERLRSLSDNYRNFYSNDFSKFEASYWSKLFWDIEYWLLARFLPTRRILLKQYANVCSGWQKCTNNKSTIQAFVRGRRMSGEMTTSFTHFIYNMCLTAYNAHINGVLWDGVFEGDDSVVAYSAMPTFTVYERLGIVIKVQYPCDIEKASFCHIEMNGETLHRMRHPAEVLVKLPMTDSKFKITHDEHVRRGLLRAKLLSYLYELPNCPIISPLSKRLSKVILEDPIFINDGYHRIMTEPDNTDIFLSDRIKMEEFYGISVDLQLACERAIEGMTEIPETLPDVFTDVVRLHKDSSIWADCWNRYVTFD